MSDLKKFDLTTERYREYEFLVSNTENYGKTVRNYTIEEPVSLFFRDGCTTHRVVDSKGVVHCVPAPGYHGCVLRWVNKDSDNPVNF